MKLRTHKNSFKKYVAVWLTVAFCSAPWTVFASGEQIKLPIEDGLQQELSKHYEVVKEQITNYQPRTEHLDADGSPHYVNRLIREDSPYLLQHAHNPVNWFSWGEEALLESRRTNKPIFLSIGYATCHWCHVMEREVFEDLEVAQYMNDNYIAWGMALIGMAYNRGETLLRGNVFSKRIVYGFVTACQRCLDRV